MDRGWREVQFLRILLLAITVLISAALPAAASDLLIVQSRHHDVYDQAVRLIQNSCGNSSETLLLSDYAEFDLGRIVREERPRLVVAIGEQAFKEARKLHRTAVVYALTLNVDEKSLGSNVSGVSMYVTPDNYVKLFKKLQLKRIGILYDPHHSGAWLERARKAAAGSGVELVPVTVRSPREVSAALKRLQQLSIDGLWMIPDSSAVAPESVDAYFRFAQQQRLPVFSFARGYLDKGAVVALEGSYNSIAAQSCALISRIRSGEATTETTTVDISEASLFTNENVADRLQLKLIGLERLFPSHRE